MTRYVFIDEILEHFGVKNMKWGVRRDRRKATSARKDARRGKEAVKVALSKGAKSIKDRAKAGEAKIKARQEAAKKAKPKTMSQAELQQAIQRMQMERQFKSLQIQAYKDSVPPGLNLIFGAVERGVSQGVTNTTADVTKRLLLDAIDN